MRCQCLERGCIQDILFLLGRRKTVLVIRRSCSAHFLRSKRPLLLHFPTPSGPITPSQVWWSVPTLALKSPRRISLSVRGVAEIYMYIGMRYEYATHTLDIRSVRLHKLRESISDCLSSYLSHHECIYPSINDPDSVFRPSPESVVYARVLHHFSTSFHIFLYSINC